MNMLTQSDLHSASDHGNSAGIAALTQEGGT
jgi:hypothetical protein